MKKILFVFLLILPFLIIFLSPDIKSYLEYKLSYSYCDRPITYRIDTVDPKFNLSKDEFTVYVMEAEKAWEKSVDLGKFTKNRELFEFNSAGELSINLIFDERQSLTNEIRDLEGKVDADKSGLSTKISEYEKLSQQFKRKLSDFEAEVKDWNSKGGAPEDIYNKLNARQDELQKEGDSLNEIAKNLNLSTKTYNAQINQLNQTIKNFNEDLLEKPEEGIFKGPENRIEIFFNNGKNELVHTLEHELGHALGLEHISNPKAIMYYKTNQVIKPSLLDIEALEAVCRRHDLIEIIQYYFSNLQLNLSKLSN